MIYEVIFSPEAVEDLERLFDHILNRELNSSTGDLGVADRAIEAIDMGCQTLARSPFNGRKVGASPFLREFIIPFGRTGYVALYEIRNAKQVIVGAVRHQVESDYH